MVSYNKLWKLLIDKHLTKTQLMKLAKISTTSLAKLTKGQSISTNILCKICNVLHCDFGDIMQFVAY
ncbi:helix-turn-helix transcriptional regulator [bacterium]|nr:helix-turn-helix transcriptional regulator [bacterium]